MRLAGWSLGREARDCPEVAEHPATMLDFTVGQPPRWDWHCLRRPTID